MAEYFDPTPRIDFKAGGMRCEITGPLGRPDDPWRSNFVGGILEKSERRAYRPLDLIVEDEPPIALDIHAAFSTAGADIVSTSDSRKALRLVGLPDLSADRR